MTQLQAQSIAESLAQLVERLKELNAKLDELIRSKPLGGENEQ